MRLARIEDYVREDVSGLPFTVHPEIYTDPAIFELELKHIFEKTWNFITLESELASPHDYVSARIGRTPVLVTRNKEGQVGAYLNACRHKGSLICASAKGNARIHVCPYHSWSYDSGGRLVAIRDSGTGEYSDEFKNSNHDLIPLPRFESYRGFLFGSLSTEVPPLTEFLGGMKFFIDLLLDRYPEGVEIVPGVTSYTYGANWKFQLENSMDAYHLASTHKTYLDIIEKRRNAQRQDVKEVTWQLQEQRQGIYSFEHGHTALWIQETGKVDRPDDVAAEAVRAQVGDFKADWMRRARNYLFFPNMQVQDGQALMLRTYTPLAVDLTEMNTYCVAPINEDDETRNWRLRQYEDFFNVSGFATPDDSVVYEWSQEGNAAAGLPYLQGQVRGAARLHPGTDARLADADANPVTSCEASMITCQETGAYQPYRVWLKMMQNGIASDRIAAQENAGEVL